MYSLRYPDTRRLAIWGFGIWCGELGVGGVFLGRSKFEPLWTQADDLREGIWSPEQLTVAPVSEENWYRCLRELLPGALHGISAYERWIVRESGSGYRRECLSSIKRLAVCPDAMAEAWDELALQLASSHRRTSRRPVVADASLIRPAVA